MECLLQIIGIYLYVPSISRHHMIKMKIVRTHSERWNIDFDSCNIDRSEIEGSGMLRTEQVFETR